MNEPQTPAGREATWKAIETWEGHKHAPDYDAEGAVDAAIDAEIATLREQVASAEANARHDRERCHAAERQLEDYKRGNDVLQGQWDAAEQRVKVLTEALRTAYSEYHDGYHSEGVAVDFTTCPLLDCRLHAAALNPQGTEAPVEKPAGI